MRQLTRVVDLIVLAAIGCGVVRFGYALLRPLPNAWQEATQPIAVCVSVFLPAAILAFALWLCLGAWLCGRIVTWRAIRRLVASAVIIFAAGVTGYSLDCAVWAFHLRKHPGTTGPIHWRLVQVFLVMALIAAAGCWCGWLWFRDKPSESEG